jgi:hypothetical protein
VSEAASGAVRFGGHTQHSGERRLRKLQRLTAVPQRRPRRAAVDASRCSVDQVHVGAALSGHQAHDIDTAPSRTAKDGVYTGAQGKRGQMMPTARKDHREGHAVMGAFRRWQV